jgi:hypothetical protein
MCGIPQLFSRWNGKERTDLRAGEELTRKMEKFGPGEWRVEAEYSNKAAPHRGFGSLEKRAALVSATALVFVGVCCLT